MCSGMACFKRCTGGNRLGITTRKKFVGVNCPRITLLKILLMHNGGIYSRITLNQ